MQKKSLIFIFFYPYVSLAALHIWAGTHRPLNNPNSCSFLGNKSLTDYSFCPCNRICSVTLIGEGRALSQAIFSSDP